MLKMAVLTLFLGCASCAYNTSFEDCGATCASNAECPDDLTCGSEGLCRTPGAPGTCATFAHPDSGTPDASDPDAAIPDSSSPDAPDAPATQASASCVGLAATCGPASNESCCSTATTIPGGTFYRSYDVAADGAYPSMGYPATVSSFKLDRFEVTVGRFRKFVDAGMGTQTKPPSEGAGSRRLNGMNGQAGWSSSWNANLVSNATALKSALKCNATYQTWTDTPGSNETMPINCLTWYEAIAFCIWDGGYLPTETEWNYAASGGGEQRAYPWSAPASSTNADCSYANFKETSYCVNPPNGAANRVGSESPKGDGRWSHSDLAGNSLEWTLDVDAPYASSCTDCVAFGSGSKIIRGGSMLYGASFMRSSERKAIAADFRGGDIGLRCARPQ